jgi:predicted transcriptional regulator
MLTLEANVLQCDPMETGTQKRGLALRVQKPLRRRLERIAARRYKSLSEVCREAFTDFVEREEAKGEKLAA